MSGKSFHPSQWPPRFMRVTAAARRPSAARGFTLVELLLVMALLAVVLAIGLPSLSVFFRGRNLDAEARRILALTHHGQSRAVSEGIPMRLWVDADEGTYGLKAEAGWDEKDGRAVELKLAKDLKLELTLTNLPTSRLSAARMLETNLRKNDEKELPEFKFLPDGSIDESSPPRLVVSQREGGKLTLRQSRSGLYYEIEPAQD
jgi:type II secretion system protein H